MDDSLMLATNGDDTWNVLNMQHIYITTNSKWLDYSDIPSGGYKKIKWPTHMVEGGYHVHGSNDHAFHMTHFYL